MGHEICQFLENDMEGCFSDATESAIYNQARNEAAVKRIANETSISINQLLQRAKEEFAQNKSDLGKAVMEKVSELEEHYSADEIYEQLRSRLGLRFVQAFRNKLHEEILDALSIFQHEGALEEEINQHADKLHQIIGSWFKKAKKQVDGKFQDPQIRKLIINDIKELKGLYCDPEALKEKFKPYIEK